MRVSPQMWAGKHRELPIFSALRNVRLAQKEGFHRDSIGLLTDWDDGQQYRALTGGRAHDTYVSGGGVSDEQKILVRGQGQGIRLASHMDASHKLAVIDAIDGDRVRVEVAH